MQSCVRKRQFVTFVERIIAVTTSNFLMTELQSFNTATVTVRHVAGSSGCYCHLWPSENISLLCSHFCFYSLFPFQSPKWSFCKAVLSSDVQVHAFLVSLIASACLAHILVYLTTNCPHYEISHYPVYFIIFPWEHFFRIFVIFVLI
jgi:hypothetical protein